MNTVNRPKQARSRETYERLLDAAQDIMLAKSYESVSIEEIAQHAGLTTGAFYARFKNKATLLIALSERTGRHIETVLAALEEFGAGDHGLADRVERFVNELFQFNRRYKGLLRAIRRTAVENPNLQDTTTALNQRLKQRLLDYFRPAFKEINHKRPEQAIEVSLTLIFSTLRMLTVEDDLLPNEFKAPERHSVAGLTDAVTRYLKQN